MNGRFFFFGGAGFWSARKAKENKPSDSYLLTVVGTARGQRAALSVPRSAALQHGQANAAREVFRPLHAGGDAAAQRPYLPIMFGR